MTSLEALDAEGLLRHQWTRLLAVAEAAVPANPFVTAQWKRAGLASARDLRSWEDFARLPLIGKRELMEDQAAHPPFGRNLSYPLDRYVRVHQTSGTTGTPLRWLDTEESWEWWARCWTAVLRGAGLGPGDRIFFPFSFGLFVGFWAGFEGARRLGAMAIPGGGQDSAQRLAAMQALGATAVCCTPSYALHLTEVARERGVALDRLGIRATVHAGEPGAGIPAVRARIQACWGARAYDHAGMTEMGAYGFECAEQSGLHVNEAEFIAEVVDVATGRPADEGELVLTNLGRLGSPLFRYRTGDRVRVARGPCACGRRFADDDELAHPTTATAVLLGEVHRQEAGRRHRLPQLLRAPAGASPLAEPLVPEVGSDLADRGAEHRVLLALGEVHVSSRSRG